MLYKHFKSTRNSVSEVKTVIPFKPHLNHIYVTIDVCVLEPYYEKEYMPFTFSLSIAFQATVSKHMLVATKGFCQTIGRVTTHNYASLKPGKTK